MQGFKQQAKTLNHEKKIHQGIDPFQCKVMKTDPFFCIPKMLQTCFQSFSNVDKLTVHGVREHGHEKPFQCNFCGQGFVRQQILDKHVKMHTGERPFRWFVNSLIITVVVHTIKLWQVWPVWWGFYPGWGSKETRPETQDQRGHPHRGRKATAWTGKKALRVLWSKICRSKCLKKAPEIPYGYQGLCLYRVRKSILWEKSKRQPLQHCALRGEELSLWPLWEAVW